MAGFLRSFRSFTVFAVLLGSGVLAGSLSPASASADPPDVIANRWTAALSAGDVERALALCDDNVSFTVQYTLNGRPIPMGKWGLAVQRASLSSPSAKGATSRLISTEVRGTVVTARVEAAGPFLASLGISRTLNTTTMDVRDGKIVSTVIDYDVSDPETARFLSAVKVYPPAAPAPPSTGNFARTPTPRSTSALEALGFVLVTLGAGTFVLPVFRRRQSGP